VRDLWIRRGRRVILLAGILGDKERRPMVSALSGIADRVVVTRPPLEERAGDAGEVAAMFAREVGARRVALEPSPERALGLALEQARPNDLVCVTGSMFLVGALRARWVPEERILRTRTSAL
jgi:dihydrofolate synthase/folylpolyglutamate synthase